MEHLDDAEVGELGVVLVVGKEDSECRADALRGKLHDELPEVEFLLGGIRDVLKTIKNIIKLDVLNNPQWDFMSFTSLCFMCSGFGESVYML